MVNIDFDKMIKEENDGADKYDKMAEEYPQFGGIFRDIATEEREHAKNLAYIKQHMDKLI